MAAVPNSSRVVSCAAKLVPLGKDNNLVNGESAVRLWDPETGVEEHSYHAHQWGITTVAVSPDGKRMLTGGFDTTVILWNLATEEKLQIFQVGCNVHGVAFAPPDPFGGNDRFAASANADGTVKVWRLPP